MVEWAGRDSNSRPSGYQPDALTRLSYRPTLIRYNFIDDADIKGLLNSHELISAHNPPILDFYSWS